MATAPTTETVSSPLGGAARFVESRPTALIIERYKSEFGYDPSPDFSGLPSIDVYECETTGYRFFHPFVEGKEELYRTLEKTDWCYEEDKWEHNTVAAKIPETASVLDIGCGRGAFLSKVRSSDRTGIELNKSAAAFTRQRGITVIETLLGDHGGPVRRVQAAGTGPQSAAGVSGAAIIRFTADD